MLFGKTSLGRRLKPRHHVNTQCLGQRRPGLRRLGARHNVLGQDVMSWIRRLGPRRPGPRHLAPRHNVFGQDLVSWPRTSWAKMSLAKTSLGKTLCSGSDVSSKTSWPKTLRSYFTSAPSFARLVQVFSCTSYVVFCLYFNCLST